jgi:hypothetical protein
MMTSVVSGKDNRISLEVLKNYLTVVINGETVDVENYVYDGITFIGLRQVSEILGATVDYDHETRTALINMPNTKGDEGIDTQEIVKDHMVINTGRNLTVPLIGNGLKQEITLYDAANQQLFMKMEQYKTDKGSQLYIEEIPDYRFGTEYVIRYSDTENKKYELTLSTEAYTSFDGGQYYKFPANPDEGFYFPYYVYFPEGYNKAELNYLLVESNNSGSTHDDLEYHENRVIESMSEDYSYGKRVADALGTPYLMPVFPRPNGNWDDYTHDLDRSSLLAELSEEEIQLMGNYQRLDLQLSHMIDNAKGYLQLDDYVLQDKIMMIGYSASAKFANKFSVLHPDLVQSLVIGGINAATMLPVEYYKGEQLMYPLGIADYEDIMGKTFDAEAYSHVKQLLIMGETDTNDVTLYRDGWDQLEAETWWTIMGKQMEQRWDNLQEAYKAMDVSIQCHTYMGIGHSITNDVIEDTIEFLKENAGEIFVEIECHP